MYIVMGLLVCILIGGFARIYFERLYRKQLAQNNQMLEWEKYDEELNKKLNEYEKKPKVSANKM